MSATFRAANSVPKAGQAAELQQVSRVRPSRQEVVERAVLVPTEAPLELRVNSETVAVLMRQPGADIELAAGFCLTEGLVARAEDIVLVRHCAEDQNVAAVTTKTARAMSPRLIWSACVGSGPELGELPPPVTPSRDYILPAHSLIKMQAYLRRQRPSREAPRGTHTAAVFDLDCRLLALHKDVGRHNAVDKAIGSCVLRRIGLDDKVLVVTGRGSSEVVLKCARARIPILASVSNTTTAGWRVAEQTAVTLIRYARAGSFEICTHAERISIGDR